MLYHYGGVPHFQSWSNLVTIRKRGKIECGQIVGLESRFDTSTKNYNWRSLGKSPQQTARRLVKYLLNYYKMYVKLFLPIYYLLRMVAWIFFYFFVLCDNLFVLILLKHYSYLLLSLLLLLSWLLFLYY